MSNFATLSACVQNLLINPREEWPKIAEEQTTVAELYRNYLVYLAAIPAAAGFVKGSLIGTSLPVIGTFRVGFGAGLATMVASYVLSLAIVYLLALLVDWLAPRFGGQPDQLRALKTVAYAFSAAMLAGVGQLLPWIGWLLTLGGGLYSIYLLYLGLPVTMRCPPEKAGAYTAVSAVGGIVLGWILALVLAGLTGGPRGTSDIRFDKGSPLARSSDWQKNIESASKDMEAAQESGDVAAQQQAFSKMMGAALGGGNVEALAPDQLKALVPDELAGLRRTRVTAERNSAMGLQFSRAQGDYADDGARSLRLEITDMGSGKGLMSLAGWAMFEQERETDTGFERVRKRDGRTVREQWDSESRHGEYALVLGERFLVELSGEVDKFDELEDAVDEIDLDKLESLRDAGTDRS